MGLHSLTEVARVDVVRDPLGAAAGALGAPARSNHERDPGLLDY